jgi:hypothetical protein
MSTAIQLAPAQPHIPHEAEVTGSILRVIGLMRAGLPKLETFIEAMLAIPMHAWSYSVARHTDRVIESVKIRYADAVYFMATLQKVSFAEIDTAHSPSFCGSIQYHLGGRPLSQKQREQDQIPTIDLSNFPKLVDQIVALARARLGENHEDRFVRLMAEVSTWKQSEQWAEQELDSALRSPTQRRMQAFNMINARAMAGDFCDTLTRESEGEYFYNIREVPRFQRFIIEDTTVTLIDLRVTMEDEYKNRDHSNYLLAKVESSAHRIQKCIPKMAAGGVSQ